MKALKEIQKGNVDVSVLNQYLSPETLLALHNFCPLTSSAPEARNKVNQLNQLSNEMPKTAHTKEPIIRAWYLFGKR